MVNRKMATGNLPLPTLIVELYGQYARRIFP